MTVDEFVTTLRELRNREPFQPFAVELKDGKAIEIDEAMAFGFIEGDGFYVSPQMDIIEFPHDQVLGIKVRDKKVAS